MMARFSKHGLGIVYILVVALSLKLFDRVIHISDHKEHGLTHISEKKSTIYLNVGSFSTLAKVIIMTYSFICDRSYEAS